jgi:hypothetical protein
VSCVFWWREGVLVQVELYWCEPLGYGTERCQAKELLPTMMLYDCSEFGIKLRLSDQGFICCSTSGAAENSSGWENERCKLTTALLADSTSHRDTVIGDYIVRLAV